VWLSTEAARGSHLDQLSKAPQPHQFLSLDIVLVSVAGVLIAVGLAGCGLFHHAETPQQQFTEALERGNSPQASYIWNNMSVEDRARFSRGEGVKPVVDQSAIAAQIEDHQEEQAGGDDDPPATVEIPVDDATDQR
jgi:hypothetical protein